MLKDCTMPFAQWERFGSTAEIYEGGNGQRRGACTFTRKKIAIFAATIVICVVVIIAAAAVTTAKKKSSANEGARPGAVAGALSGSKEKQQTADQTVSSHSYTAVISASAAATLSDIKPTTATTPENTTLPETTTSTTAARPATTSRATTTTTTRATTTTTTTTASTTTSTPQISTRVPDVSNTTKGSGIYVTTTPSLTDEPITDIPVPTELCEFKYNATCFWSEYLPTRYLSFKLADEICERNGSKPANIYSEMHYNLTIRNLQKKIPSGGFGDVATGLVINPRTKVVKTTDGRHAPYQHWYKGIPGYPLGIPSWTRIYIFTTKNQNTLAMGMLNYSPAGVTLHGVICEV